MYTKEKKRASVSTRDWRKSKVLRYRIDGLKKLAESLLAHVTDIRQMQGPGDPNEVNGLNFYEAVQQFEIELNCDALMRTQGHQAKAARLLKLNQTTLHGKIKQYRIYPTVVVYGEEEALMGSDSSGNFVDRTGASSAG